MDVNIVRSAADLIWDDKGAKAKASDITGVFLGWDIREKILNENSDIFMETPQRLIGYIWCDEIIGEVSHTCQHGPPPHHIKICIPEELNQSNYNEISKYFSFIKRS